MKRASTYLLFAFLPLLCAAVCQAESGFFDIPRLGDIAIDGSGDDWGNQGFLIPLLPGADGRIKAPADLDACAMLGWNEQGLLLLARVEDDLFKEHPNLDRLWSFDSIEVFVGTEKGAPDYCQFVFSPGVDRKYPELRIHIYDCRRTIEGAPPSCTAVRTREENGYTLEALFPWSNLAVQPAVGREIGVQISVNDRDVSLYHALWYPKAGTSRDSTLMQRVRLAERPSPIAPRAAAGFSANGYPRVCVAGGPELIGKSVTVKQGERFLASGEVATRMGRPFLELRLPYPEKGAAYGALDVAVEGERIAELEGPEGSAPALSVEITLPERPGGPIRVVPGLQPAGDVFPEVAVHLEARDLQGKLVSESDTTLGTEASFALEPGFYRIEARAPEFFGWALSAERLCYVGGDVRSATLDAVRRGRGAEKAPRLQAYAGLFNYLAFLVEEAWEIGAEDAPKQATDAAARLSEWIGRAEADPEACRSLRGTHEWAYLSRTDGTGQPFMIAVPPDYDPERAWPLHVQLHGSGGTHKNFVPTDHRKPFILLNPMGRAPGGGYNGLSEADVLEAIDYVRAHWNVDPDRIHLFGVSMGGGGTFSLASRHPDLFASARPYCGFGLPDPVENMLHVPTYAVHGTADNAVPIAMARAPIRLLSESGGEAVIEEVPDVGHDVLAMKEATGRAEAWVEGRTRRKRVREIRYVAEDESARGAYWVKVLEWGPFSGPAKVRAILDEDNALSLTLENVRSVEIDLAQSPASPDRPLKFVVNGGPAATVGAPLAERLYCTLWNEGWVLTAEAPAPPPQRLHFPGGAPALFHGEPILVVWGTRGTAEANAAMIEAARAARRACRPEWTGDLNENGALPRDSMLFGRLPGKPDVEVTDADMARSNLLLIGTAEQNAVVARLAEKLPVKIAEGRVVASDGIAWDFEERALGLLYYNPLAPGRLIYWVASETPAAYKAGTPLMALQRQVASPDLLMTHAERPRIVAARCFDSRWNWAAGYAESPLLPDADCTVRGSIFAYAEAIRAALGAEYALVAHPNMPSDDAQFAAGETRTADLLNYMEPNRLSIMEISGKELIEAAAALGASRTLGCRFLPPPGEGTDPERSYRVALYGWAILDYATVMHSNPETYRLAEVTERQAFERAILKREGDREE
jgi:predicted esterase